MSSGSRETDVGARADTVTHVAGSAARRATLVLIGCAVLGTAAFVAALPTRTHAQQAAAPTDNGTCGLCHEGIEDMHPFAPVTCVQCHGGDDTATEPETAHVQPRGRLPGDERVLGRGVDPAYLRFVDPGNLRVAEASCGPCHPKAVYDVHHSLHASTAGHLGDGLYENGVVDRRGPLFSVFPVKDERPDDVERPDTAVRVLKQIPPMRRSDPERVSTHFSDLPRKACMQCHLWSRGRAIRGRAGMDGDYRGEGCSACHVPYADDGLSQSRDKTVDRFEPGHPRRHEMVRFPDTATCTRCHYGDASIGLSFRGLAQPVPGMPQSPDAPGLHRKRLNGVYYIDDPAATPADVHHQRGMHCVDCHTRNDTMGDGNLYARMEDAIEIRCETCHGDWNSVATGVTKSGNRLPHLEIDGDEVHLVSRVTGERHRVKQARHVVRPGSDDFNSHAALAMSDDHARLECYACHSGWNPNFFGFHFDRNEQFTQLDMISGTRTAGRVTTQEKVFSTFKHFYVGWNSHGRIAPYMVGFSSMASAHDKDGELVFAQRLPETRAGLSGMTMIHHQTHTTTARARECVECHRSPTALGRGSVNFRLARDFAVSGGDAGVRFVSLDRKNPAGSALLSVVAVEDVRALAVETDRISGHLVNVFAATASGELVVVDATTPAFPRVRARLAGALTEPQALVLRDGALFAADGEAGVVVFRVGKTGKPRSVAAVSEMPAYGLHLDGTRLHVAAGAQGLGIVDVADAEAPRVLLDSLDLNGRDTAAVVVDRVSVLFQYSRPDPAAREGPRSRPRNLAVLGTRGQGLWLVDATEPAAPRTIMTLGAGRVRDVALATHYELGSEGGAIPTRERDLIFWLTDNQLGVLDVTDAATPRPRGVAPVAGGGRALTLARVYNPPFLQSFVLVQTAAGLSVVDAQRPDRPQVVASIAALAGGRDVAMEEFDLDRTVDRTGAPIMDVSHEGARWLDAAEYRRVIETPVMLPGARRRGTRPVRDGGRR